LRRASISRGFIAVFPVLGLYFVAFSGSIYVLFMAPCPLRTFLHFVPIGWLHRLRMFALIGDNLVYGLLVARPFCSVYVVRRLGFALVIALIPSV
jgi:hypothetical protein